MLVPFFRRREMRAREISSCPMRLRRTQAPKPSDANSCVNEVVSLELRFQRVVLEFGHRPLLPVNAEAALLAYAKISGVREPRLALPPSSHARAAWRLQDRHSVLGLRFHTVFGS